jgi:hypothetical protein
MSDAPDHDSGKLVDHARDYFRAPPVIPNNDFVTFGDQIQNFDMDIRESLIRTAYVRLCAGRPWRRSGGHICSVILKFGREVGIGHIKILAIYEVFKMVASRLLFTRL